jgi:hypothetical protein
MKKHYYFSFSLSTVQTFLSVATLINGSTLNPYLKANKMQKMCTFHLPECLNCNLIESCFLEMKRKTNRRIIQAPENNVTNLINLTREITERLSRTKPTF